MLPAPPAPVQTNDSLSTEERGGIADDDSTSDRDVRGVVNELVDVLDDDLAHLNSLDVMRDFDLDPFLQEHRQQALAAGDAGDGKAEAIGSSQGGEVDASSAPAERVESEAIGWSQRGAVDANAKRAVRLTGARWKPPRSRQGGPKATSAQHQLPAPTKGTARIPPRSCRVGQRTT